MHHLRRGMGLALVLLAFALPVVADTAYVPIAQNVVVDGKLMRTELWVANDKDVVHGFTAYFIKAGTDGTVRTDEPDPLFFVGIGQSESFEGLGMTGYDNVAGTYWGAWTDSGGTGMMTSTGKCSGGSCEFTGSFMDPMTGKQKTVRATMKRDDDLEIHAMYDLTPDGEVKTMQLVYTRAK